MKYVLDVWFNGEKHQAAASVIPTREGRQFVLSLPNNGEVQVSLDFVLSLPTIDEVQVSLDDLRAILAGDDVR
jgi:hypothetical protein